MSISFSADEIFWLELILIPAVVSILSVVIWQHVLFGKDKWNQMSDTEKEFKTMRTILYVIDFFQMIFRKMYMKEHSYY